MTRVRSDDCRSQLRSLTSYRVICDAAELATKESEPANPGQSAIQDSRAMTRVRSDDCRSQSSSMTYRAGGARHRQPIRVLGSDGSQWLGVEKG